MLDYFIHNDQLVIVLERPEHCCDLYDFISARPNGLDERLARDFLKQIIQILKDVHQCGVSEIDSRKAMHANAYLLGITSRYQRWKFPRRYTYRTNLSDRFRFGSDISRRNLYRFRRYGLLCSTRMGDMSSILWLTTNSLVIGDFVIRPRLRWYSFCWWTIHCKMSTTISSSFIFR